MMIDSHNHSGYIDKDAAAVVAEMDQIGIDVCWLLTWILPPAEDAPHYHPGTSPLYLRPDGTHAAIPLAEVMSGCNRFPHRFIPGYCPNPTESDPAALFEAAYKIHGVRVCGEWSYRTLLDDPRSLELFRCAGRLKCPVVLHMDVPYLTDASGRAVYQKFWYGGTVANLERALQACPETVFIGHGPGFWRDISGDAAQRPEVYPSGPLVPGGKLLPMFERYPNLWADLSAGSGLTAMRRHPDQGKAFITRYSDRLLYGRDAHGNALNQFLDGLRLPAAVLRKVRSENALRLVPLPDVVKAGLGKGGKGARARRRG